MSVYRTDAHGFIEVIVGPMYSGKTSALMSRIRREVYAGKKAIVFKPTMDDRYSTDEIMTHDGETLHAHSIRCTMERDPFLAVEPTAISLEILDHVDSSVDVVGIDEGQFFDLNLVEVCEKLANEGLRVIIAGVDMDYRCQPWRPMSDLMAVAEFVEKIPAVCFTCGREATKIQRFFKDRISMWNEPTIIVGSNKKDDDYKYEARCRKCYISPPKIIKGGSKK